MRKAVRAPLALTVLALVLWGLVPPLLPRPATPGCVVGADEAPALWRFVAGGGYLDAASALAAPPAPAAAPAPAPAAKPLPPGKFAIIVDASLRRLFLLQDGRVYKEYPVAVGTPENPTPIGHWRIIEKDAWGGGFGARWMRLSVPWGQFGIHGTNNPASIGTRASHGCIRMFNRDVKGLFEFVSVGTPVTVRGRPTARFGETRREVCPVNLGTDIYEMQRRLAALGFYKGPLDGQFGAATIAALQAFQQHKGLLSERGCLGPRSYDALGLRPYAEDPDLKPGQVPPGGLTNVSPGSGDQRR